MEIFNASDNAPPPPNIELIDCDEPNVIELSTIFDALNGFT